MPDNQFFIAITTLSRQILLAKSISPTEKRKDRPDKIILSLTFICVLVDRKLVKRGAEFHFYARRRAERELLPFLCLLNGFRQEI